MAGIGFTLDRMTKGPSLSVIVGAYVYAAFLVAGPWIFTVLGIGGVSLAACSGTCPSVQVFRSVIIYNSVFSLVVTSPIAFVCTRYISDRIYLRRYESVLYAAVTALALFAAIAALVGGPFYALATTLRPIEIAVSLQNLMLLGTCWLLIPFLGAMRDQRTVMIVFALGAAIMVGATGLVTDASPAWLISVFNLGLGVIDSVLIWRLQREYGLPIVRDNGLWRCAVVYWELPLIGVTYGLGLWIDKLIMWVAAPGPVVRVAGALQTMPNYDTPMFWAQLAALPVVAVFFVHVETNFFRLCRAFYDRIDQRATRWELEAAMARLAVFVRTNIIGLFVGLAAICGIAIVISFVAVDPIGLRVAQMGVLRFALIGMVCHTSAMFCFIFFLYFDLRRAALIISTVYLVCNGVLTAALLPFGFAFFGYGNMLASAAVFLTALLLLMRELPWLHYHAFVTNNQSALLLSTTSAEPARSDARESSRAKSDSPATI